MNKHLLRIIACLLIACLLADPVTAAAFYTPWEPAKTVHIPTALLETQAVVPYENFERRPFGTFDRHWISDTYHHLTDAFGGFIPAIVGYHERPPFQFDVENKSLAYSKSLDPTSGNNRISNDEVYAFREMARNWIEAQASYLQQMDALSLEHSTREDWETYAVIGRFLMKAIPPPPKASDPRINKLFDNALRDTLSWFNAGEHYRDAVRANHYSPDDQMAIKTLHRIRRQLFTRLAALANLPENPPLLSHRATDFRDKSGNALSGIPLLEGLLDLDKLDRNFTADDLRPRTQIKVEGRTFLSNGWSVAELLEKIPARVLPRDSEGRLDWSRITVYEGRRRVKNPYVARFRRFPLKVQITNNFLQKWLRLGGRLFVFGSGIGFAVLAARSGLLFETVHSARPIVEAGLALSLHGTPWIGALQILSWILIAGTVLQNLGPNALPRDLGRSHGFSDISMPFQAPSEGNENWEQRIIRPEYLDGTGYQPGLHMADGVNLSSNENPLGPLPHVLEAVAALDLSSIWRYPESSSQSLRQALAHKYGVDSNRIIVGAGSSELIDLLAKTVLTPRDSMAIFHHSFISYGKAGQSRSSRIISVPVPVSDFRQDLSALAARIEPDTKIIYIANPNNPTGTYNTRQELETLLEETQPSKRHGHPVLIVVDRAYYQYAEALNPEGYPKTPDLLDLQRRYPHLVLLQTYSKIFALAGYRVGYAIADPAIIAAMDRARIPFNVRTDAQVAAEASLQDEETQISRSVQLVRDAQKQVLPVLVQLGFRALPSFGNFTLVDVTPFNGADVARALFERRVAIRPMGEYNLPQHIRVSYGLPSQNEQFLNALRDVLAYVPAQKGSGPVAPGGVGGSNALPSRDPGKPRGPSDLSMPFQSPTEGPVDHSGSTENQPIIFLSDVLKKYLNGALLGEPISLSRTELSQFYGITFKAVSHIVSELTELDLLDRKHNSKWGDKSWVYLLAQRVSTQLVTDPDLANRLAAIPGLHVTRLANAMERFKMKQVVNNAFITGGKKNESGSDVNSPFREGTLKDFVAQYREGLVLPQLNAAMTDEQIDRLLLDYLSKMPPPIRGARDGRSAFNISRATLLVRLRFGVGIDDWRIVAFYLSRNIDKEEALARLCNCFVYGRGTEPVKFTREEAEIILKVAEDILNEPAGVQPVSQDDSKKSTARPPENRTAVIRLALRKIIDETSAQSPKLSRIQITKEMLWQQLQSIDPTLTLHQIGTWLRQSWHLAKMPDGKIETVRPNPLINRYEYWWVFNTATSARMADLGPSDERHFHWTRAGLRTDDGVPLSMMNRIIKQPLHSPKYEGHDEPLKPLSSSEKDSDPSAYETIKKKVLNTPIHVFMEKENETAELDELAKAGLRINRDTTLGDVLDFMIAQRPKHPLTLKYSEGRVDYVRTDLAIAAAKAGAGRIGGIPPNEAKELAKTAEWKKQTNAPAEGEFEGKIELVWNRRATSYYAVLEKRVLKNPDPEGEPQFFEEDVLMLKPEKYQTQGIATRPDSKNPIKRETRAQLATLTYPASLPVDYSQPTDQIDIFETTPDASSSLLDKTVRSVTYRGMAIRHDQETFALYTHANPINPRKIDDPKYVVYAAVLVNRLGQRMKPFIWRAGDTVDSEEGVTISPHGKINPAVARRLDALGVTWPLGHAIHAWALLKFLEQNHIDKVETGTDPSQPITSNDRSELSVSPDREHLKQQIVDILAALIHHVHSNHFTLAIQDSKLLTALLAPLHDYDLKSLFNVLDPDPKRTMYSIHSDPYQTVKIELNRGDFWLYDEHRGQPPTSIWLKPHTLPEHPGLKRLMADLFPADTYFNILKLMAVTAMRRSHWQTAREIVEKVRKFPDIHGLRDLIYRFDEQFSQVLLRSREEQSAIEEGLRDVYSASQKPTPESIERAKLAIQNLQHYSLTRDENHSLVEFSNRISNQPNPAPSGTGRGVASMDPGASGLGPGKIPKNPLYSDPENPGVPNAAGPSSKDLDNQIKAAQEMLLEIQDFSQDKTQEWNERESQASEEERRQWQNERERFVEQILSLQAKLDRLLKLQSQPPGSQPTRSLTLNPVDEIIGQMNRIRLVGLATIEQTSDRSYIRLSHSRNGSMWQVEGFPREPIHTAEIAPDSIRGVAVLKIGTFKRDYAFDLPAPFLSAAVPTPDGTINLGVISLFGLTAVTAAYQILAGSPGKYAAFAAIPLTHLTFGSGLFLVVSTLTLLSGLVTKEYEQYKAADKQRDTARKRLEASVLIEGTRALQLGYKLKDAVRVAGLVKHYKTIMAILAGTRQNQLKYRNHKRLQPDVNDRLVMAFRTLSEEAKNNRDILSVLAAGAVGLLGLLYGDSTSARPIVESTMLILPSFSLSGISSLLLGSALIGMATGEPSDLPAKRRMLLVDDEPWVSFDLTPHFEKLGYEVIRAYNGQEALEQLHNSVEPFDIILTDTRMPLMDGPTLIRELKKIEAQGKVIPPIILHSAASHYSDALALGVRYLDKGESLKTYASVVEEEIAKFKSDHPPAAGGKPLVGFLIALVAAGISMAAGPSTLPIGFQVSLAAGFSSLVSLAILRQYINKYPQHLPPIRRPTPPKGQHPGLKYALAAA